MEMAADADRLDARQLFVMDVLKKSAEVIAVMEIEKLRETEWQHSGLEVGLLACGDDLKRFRDVRISFWLWE